MSKEKEDEIVGIRLGGGCFLLIILITLMTLAITSIIFKPYTKKSTPKDIIEMKNLAWEQYLESAEAVREKTRGN